MANLTWWLCLGLSLAAVTNVSANPALSDNRPLQLANVVIVSSKVPRYSLAEFRLGLQGTYSNAFDPNEIELNGIVKTPRGENLTVPGFFYQDYTRELRDGKEVMTPNGLPEWRIRFAPVEVGAYSLVISARDRTGSSVRSSPVKFRCVDSKEPGFVRRSSADKRYFTYDNGQSYVPIGANVCWAGARGTFDYDDWLPRYSEAGGNYFRLWLGPGWTTFALEHTGQPEDRYGVGKFDLEHAWRLDYVLGLAVKNGQYVMLCLDSYNELRKKAEEGYPYWDETPHNAANGGPLNEPREFWTDPTMARIYRNKLRYLVARYGWNPHVMSWEFWNEVDIISATAYVPDEVKTWHADMSDYLRSIDPWKHLQTTSFANSTGEPKIDRLPQMDYTQTHNYGSRDVAAGLTRYQQQKEAYGKPHYVGEFGTDAGGPDGKVDPGGIAMHNGMWSTIMSGAAGPAMLWWWDNFIHPSNMYWQFSTLGKFIKGIDFPNQAFQHIEKAEFVFADSAPDLPYRDMELGGPVSWEASPENKPTTVEIDAAGAAKTSGPVAGILHGMANHRDKHNPLTFTLDLPHETRLRVIVSGVSGHGGAHLVATLDGKSVVDKDMPDMNTEGKHDTLHSYDGEYAIDVPTGKHTIVVENTGTDWVLVHYVVERAERPTGLDLRLFGLRGRDVSLLWVQNSLHTWSRVHTLKHDPDPQPASVLNLADWPQGKYTVHFWDTYTGKETSTEDLTVGSGGLHLKLPTIPKDIALKIEKGKP